MKVFKDLWWFFKIEKRAYGLGILVLALVSLLTLTPPLIVGVIVDHIVEETLSSSLLAMWIGVLLLVGILAYGLRYVWRILIFGASIRLARLLRNQLYTHFTNMSQRFYQRHRTGDLMAHATNDIRAVQMTAGQGVLTLVDSLTMGGFVIITMAATISWQLTLICLIPMPFMAYLTSYYGTLLHKRFHLAQSAFSELNDNVQESVTGVRVAKTFGQEEDEIKRFREKSLDVVDKNVAVAKVDALFDPTISLIVGISYFLAVVFGAQFVIAEQITIGQLTTFTLYLGLLIWPMLAFGWLFNIVERGRASYDRISLLLEEKQDITDETTNEQKVTGDLNVSISSFSYPGSREHALKEISFTLKEGQTLGIVGKTGSGKSTLIRLLQREYELEHGEIKIGDFRLDAYRLDDLKATFGNVPQDHFLFSATIADNVAFAKPNASLGEIMNSCKLANIHEDIIGFQEGYETVVGERGVTLSWGSKTKNSDCTSRFTKSECAYTG
ncbi:transport ATP-binding protein CydC [Halalkalibacter wakoensis JCM 9140]|uniref:Transport ATP-binding protein CydC n=1 Tax=Halalkalibacter wakoensis JCM 9140 TaxID=1236970 RepID=W4PY09_9BACI|nr:transport ATP-binding protein CydC [Halalkalibacter wakoensis JCM 9140]